MKSRLFFAMFCAGFVLSACNTEPKQQISAIEAFSIAKVIDGKISYDGPASIPATAQISIRLQDVSLADAPATTIAKAIINEQKSFPVYFSLAYDAAKIQPGRQYTIGVRIENKSKLIFINDTSVSAMDASAQAIDIAVVSIP